MPVDLRQRLFAHISRGDGQESAGKDLSQVGDEHKALTIVDTARSSPDAVGCAHANHCRFQSAIAFTFFLGSALKQKATIMLGFGALNVELHAL